MSKFETIFQSLLKNPQDSVLEIDGKRKTIKAFIHLTTQNFFKENGDYYKIMFVDGSFMLIAPSDQEFYYAEKLLGKIEEIGDDVIGNKEVLNFNGKDYRLENKNDYQFVLELLAGSPLDIEGECRFSDYTPVSGPKEILSLGWLTRTGQRADINCHLLNHDQINIIN